MNTRRYEIMNTNFNYRFNCACDEISWRQFEIFTFTDFVLKKYFPYFPFEKFVPSEIKIAFELRITFLTRKNLSFYFQAKLIIRPRSRDPWGSLQESWQESTRKNKRSETGNSNLIVDVLDGIGLIRDSSRFTDSRRVYTSKGYGK